MVDRVVLGGLVCGGIVLTICIFAVSYITSLECADKDLPTDDPMIESCRGASLAAMVILGTLAPLSFYIFMTYGSKFTR